MMFTPIPASAGTGSSYKVTFAGRGESKIVDNVLVENLTTGGSVELQGQDILVLTPYVSGIDDINVNNDGDINTDGGMLSVNLKNPAFLNIDVFSLDGRLAWQTGIEASSCRASVSLPPLSKGMYLVRVSAPGFSKSIKWLSYGDSQFTLPDFNNENASVGDYTQANDPVKAVADMADAPKEVELAYNKGDVIRFTGTSGNMTTITTGSPRCSFTQHFDFFKCQDADGHNYAIVRAGDMLWMAEDLRKVNSLGITDASNLSSDILNKVISDNTTELVAADGDNTYYSKAAAIKALPEGWKLPTQGEIDYVINKLNGGKYAIAGEYFKGDNKEGVDSTYIRLNLNGRYNGNVCDDGNAYLMTRSTKGGVTLAMQLSESSNAVSVDVCPDYMLVVRGVRSAPSAYTEMLEDMKVGSSTEESISAPTQSALEDRGPLGKTYIMHTVPQSIAYDFSGGQFFSGKGENRSGILTKDSEGNWTLGERRDVDFLSDLDIDNVNDQNKLRKMAVLNNGNGTQYILEMQWSRPFRIVTERLANENSDGSLSYSYQRTDT
ncbi:MAG: FISUMP domain-containing protein, partial [Muribaculaceae bacterium]